MYLYKIKLFLAFGLLLTLTVCSNNHDTSKNKASSIKSFVFDTSIHSNNAFRASFNEDIFIATIGANSFNLSKTNNIDGIATFDGKTKITTVQPDSGLDIITKQAFALKSTITNFVSYLLEGNSNWSSDNHKETRSDSAVIQVDNSTEHDADAPQIAFDNNGNAIMVWQQTDNSVFSIWANRYDASTRSWDIAAVIETDNAGHAYNPKIAFDTSGNVIAVWWQDDGSVKSIWTNQYDAKTRLWGMAALIEDDDSGDAFNPKISIDSSGNAIAVWRQFDGKVDSIWANHFDATTRMWGTKAEIEKDNSEDAYDPQIAVDTNGNAMALWTQSNGMVDSIWANRYDTINQLWGTATVINIGDIDGAYNPQIAFDASNNAIALWNQFNGKAESKWTSHYDAITSTWGIATAVETDGFKTKNDQIRFNANGSDITVWSQDVSLNGSNSLISEA
ncbi:MAG: hypothetical protein ACJA0I_001575 [Gammaproteobacteria bacterium]|jgi:hypothetical protein